MRLALKGYDWNKLENMTVEKHWQAMKNKIMETVDKYVPKITKNISNLKEKKTWLSDNVRKKIKIKVNAFRKYLSTRAQDDFNSYARARNQAKWACRNAAKEYELNEP